MTNPPEEAKKKKKSSQQVHLRLEKDLVDALHAQAAKEGISTTELTKRYMKRGLGLEEESPKTHIDIDEIEKRVLERISERVSQIDEAALEERLYKRVSERVSQDWISYAITLEAQIHKSISERISPLETAFSEQSSSGSIKRISCGDTNRYTEELAQTELTEDKEPDITQAEEENTTSSPMPLLGSISDGQIITVPELVKYLNQVVDPNPKNPWTRAKLRSYKKKLLTYLKKPLDKREGSPPCPVVINGYIVDWIPTENEPIHSYGRQWWIQHLPKNPDEAENLIKVRHEQWKSFP